MSPVLQNSGVAEAYRLNRKRVMFRVRGAARMMQLLADKGRIPAERPGIEHPQFDEWAVK